MHVDHGNQTAGSASPPKAGHGDARLHDQLARWIMRLCNLADHCSGLDRRDMGQLMLQAEAVILDCPPSLSRWCHPASLPAGRVRRLEAGAYVDFALDLCAEPMSFMITRSCDGQALATIALPPLGEERTCEAEELPLAIVEALARLLAQMAQGFSRRQESSANGHRLH